MARVRTRDTRFMGKAFRGVIREHWHPPQVQMGHPDNPATAKPRQNPQNLLGSTCGAVSNGSAVAAGPSTCGDMDSRRHHRTTGEPGQGVDGRLLCPVINRKASSAPWPAALSGIARCGCDKKSLVQKHEFLRA